MKYLNAVLIHGGLLIAIAAAAWGARGVALAAYDLYQERREARHAFYLQKQQDRLDDLRLEAESARVMGRLDEQIRQHRERTEQARREQEQHERMNAGSSAQARREYEQSVRDYQDRYPAKP